MAVRNFERSGSGFDTNARHAWTPYVDRRCAAWGLRVTGNLPFDPSIRQRSAAARINALALAVDRAGDRQSLVRTVRSVDGIHDLEVDHAALSAASTRSRSLGAIASEQRARMTRSNGEIDGMALPVRRDGMVRR
jgi:hypothetical protein